MPTPSTATVAPTASTLRAATTRCASAVARTKVAGGVATTTSVRWMGARTPSTVALALIAPEPIRGTTSQRVVRKSQGPAKGSSREDYLLGAGTMCGQGWGL
jgi:hypothetical protein